MKQTTVNEFRDGLNLDLHPLVTPKTVLTDNLNGTFITYNGNEFCLQNDRGNTNVASLTSGYTPIGIKEHNGILYIVSVKGNLTEIGTFPSPEYENINLENAYKEEWKGSLQNTYSPLHVLNEHSPLTDVDLGYDLKTPVTIEIQDSYDGSVNLIIIADEHKPRIINSGFSVLPNNNYKFVNRKQKVTTNIYNNIDKESELIRTSDTITNVELLGVQSGGQFKGGNYTFYIKFGDGDFNQTDVIAESGIVSIFNGNDGVPSTISGTLLDERTDKMIHLAITGLNHIYSKIYIYYSREYSDTQGFRMTEYGMLSEPIDMVEDETLEQDIPIGSHIDIATGTIVTDTIRGQELWLTGFEQTVPIEPELLNIDYHTIDWARAEAQHSNMLFLGNVGQKATFQLYHELEDFTKNPLNVKSFIEQGSLVETSENNDSFSDKNYYSVKNIYNSVGYWPNEWYRFGIVYILDDGSTTPVFNMQGKVVNGSEETFNDKGVFKTPDLDVLGTNKPINFRFELHNTNQLDSRIIGWFVVRQKRIPVTVCQGVNIGIDKRCYLPLIWDGNDWIIESFLSLDRSKEEGEPYARDGFSRKIISASSTHILRPFVEIFDSKTSAFENVKYVVSDNSEFAVSFKRLVAPSSYEDFKEKAINAFNAQSSIDYDENRDIVLEQPGLSTYFDEGDKNLLYLAVYSIQYIKNEDTYSAQDGTKFVFYFFHLPMTSQLIETSSDSFYRGNINDIQSGINRDKYDYRYIKQASDKISDSSSGIISLDPCINSNIRGMLDGSEFKVCNEYDLTCSRTNNLFNYTHPTKITDTITPNINPKCVFVNENTKSKVVSEDVIFSNLAGSGSDASQFDRTQTVFGVKTGGNGEPDIYMKDNRVNEDYGLEDYRGYNSTHNLNLVRGLFTPYIGVSTCLSQDSVSLYSIKRIDNQNERIVREQDNSEYYCVSNRLSINEDAIVYRGDCYICKVGLRILRNFIDSTAPIATTIVDPLGWETYVRQRSLYGGDTGDRENGGNDIDHKAEIADYSDINLSDLNAVDLGYWITFPCLSSYNLGLRSLDTFHTEEMALLGSPRSFYPLSGASAINKVGDSYLLNDGLSATVGRKRYNLIPNIPYSKSEFANRIMFSNVHITDAFTNGYRTFQGLSYKDYDKQYGSITKLVSFGQNLFVVMEHGLGLVPVNPKALMQTTTGEAIHIYGYGVLPNEMTIISQDYGSKYEHSVIRTPIGIYGIDVDAKKIWKFSDKQGFETISDMKIETYLKDHLEPVIVQMGKLDIRTHYNGKKGDLMFTWNKLNKETERLELHSICYNERQNTWVTRYNWKPIVSDNINDEFYSLNESAIWEHADNVGYDGHVSSWYGEDYPFEFEFVVSDPIGVNKIFDNLQIISNNVQPQEMEISIIGDDYEFKRDVVDFQNIDTRKEWKLEVYESDPLNVKTTANIHGREPKLEKIRDGVDNPKISTRYNFDKRLKQSVITKRQLLKDIYKFGRRLGNIQYKEGSWFVQIEPILINNRKEARIRDKWAKIRIKYTGEDLAVITAIKTLINI